MSIKWTILVSGVRRIMLHMLDHIPFAIPSMHWCVSLLILPLPASCLSLGVHFQALAWHIPLCIVCSRWSIWCSAVVHVVCVSFHMCMFRTKFIFLASLFFVFVLLVSYWNENLGEQNESDTPINIAIPFSSHSHTNLLLSNRRLHPSHHSISSLTWLASLSSHCSWKNQIHN